MRTERIGDAIGEAVVDAVADAIAHAIGDPDVSAETVAVAYVLMFENTDTERYRLALAEASRVAV